MLNIINQELFNFKSSEKEAMNQEKLYQLDIFTTPQASRQMQDELRGRQVLRLLSSSKEYTSFNQSISVRDNENGKRSILIRANENVRRDANIFLIAVPFNGIIKPIEYSKQYRIYKGLIASSDSRNIQFKNKKYQKILYLVVEPNMNLFDPTHKYYTDKINITIEAYSHCDGDAPDNDAYSIQNKLVLDITKDIFSFDNTYDKVDVVDTTKYRETQLYKQFKIIKDKKFEDSKTDEQPKQQVQQPVSQIKSNTQYQNRTNKNISKPNNNNNNNNPEPVKQDNLDEMIKNMTFNEDFRVTRKNDNKRKHKDPRDNR